MTLWEKLFSRKAEPRQRVRVCIECGMPIAEHKDWCSILRTQQEMERKAATVRISVDRVDARATLYSSHTLRTSAPPGTTPTIPARRIGFWMTVALVMGNMIGSGIFLVPASLAPFGGLSLAGWLVSTIGALLLAAVFAHLARLDPAAGGPYAYTRRAFGDVPAFLVAWGYWISMWVSLGALAVAFIGYLGSVVPALSRTPAAAAITSIAAIWVLVGRQRCRRPIGGLDAGRHHHPQARAAGRHRGRRSHPLRAGALRGRRHQSSSDGCGHLRRRDADVVGVPRSGVRNSSCGEHRGRGQDHPARDDPRHAPDRHRLHRQHRRRHEPRRAVSTGTVPGALCGGGENRLGRAPARPSSRWARASPRLAR